MSTTINLTPAQVAVLRKIPEIGLPSTEFEQCGIEVDDLFPLAFKGLLHAWPDADDGVYLEITPAGRACLAEADNGESL